MFFVVGKGTTEYLLTKVSTTVTETSNSSWDESRFVLP